MAPEEEAGREPVCMSAPVDLVERLREVANLKVGDRMPPWMWSGNNWGPGMSELCEAAAKEIEELRARLDILHTEPDL
jgi:hypothetical protein